MIADGEANGWLVVSAFSLGLPEFLIQLLPKSSYLTVSTEGFEFCALYRKRAARWSDVSEFGVYSVRSNGLPVAKMVGFNYSDSYEAASKARAFSKLLAGYDGGLPDTYGFNADDLAKMLSAYYLHYLAEAKPV